MTIEPYRENVFQCTLRTLIYPYLNDDVLWGRIQIAAKAVFAFVWTVILVGFVFREPNLLLTAFFIILAVLVAACLVLLTLREAVRRHQYDQRAFAAKYADIEERCIRGDMTEDEAVIELRQYGDELSSWYHLPRKTDGGFTARDVKRFSKMSSQEFDKELSELFKNEPPSS